MQEPNRTLLSYNTLLMRMVDDDTLIPCLKVDGLVKSPISVLHCILRHCGVLRCTPHSSGFARLELGAFYFAIPMDDFLQIHQKLSR